MVWFLGGVWTCVLGNPEKWTISLPRASMQTVPFWARNFIQHLYNVLYKRIFSSQINPEFQYRRLHIRTSNQILKMAKIRLFKGLGIFYRRNVLANFFGHCFISGRKTLKSCAQRFTIFSPIVLGTTFTNYSQQNLERRFWENLGQFLKVIGQFEQNVNRYVIDTVGTQKF